MSQRKHHKILIVEDDLELADMLRAYFAVQGYEMLVTAWGEKAIRMASDAPPDLILLDVHLPDIDGFEICRRLRDSHQTRHIPIIFLTERRDRVDRLQGLGLGVVDYITKPFDVQELRLRIRNTLDRVADSYVGSPVTGLPDGDAVIEALGHLIGGVGPDLAVSVATLHGLWAFRELYGFVAGDNVLQVTGLTLANAAKETGGEYHFCGHLEEDSFLLVVPFTALDRLKALIKERISEPLEYFYPADNRGENAHTPDRLHLSFGTLVGSLQDFDSPEVLIKRLLIVPQVTLAGCA